VLLRQPGYKERNGAWRHSDRLCAAVFVGDYIDRGPEQVEILEIVRRMVDTGSARDHGQARAESDRVGDRKAGWRTGLNR
jgi:hypothetical protein